MREGFQPVPLKLTNNSDFEQRLKNYLRSKIRAIREGLEPIHRKQVAWRKNYEAIPFETVREFPFHNASNLVVPIIAIHSNTLLARVVSAIIKTQPPWVCRVVAGATNSGSEIEGLGTALETYLQYVAFEPEELDLYHVYHEWLGEAIRYGTSIVKAPLIKDMEDRMVPSGDGTGQFEPFTRYDGPRPEKIPFDSFGIAPTDKTIESARFKYHVIRLQRDDLEERRFRRVYDPAAVATVLGQPDRTSPRYVQQQLEQDSGAKTVASYGWAEWDIYECWCRFQVDPSHYARIIVWYHERTNTILRAYHSYYPIEPFVAARLFYRDDNFHAYGFAEMLEPIANELSQMHNGSIDNQTVCNSKGFWADPDSKINEGYRIYPSCVVPAKKDEFGVFDIGQPSTVPIERERMSLELAEKLTGVSAPIQGTGSGFNTKRGIYTAMGTLSLLQEGNTRTDLNITDMRYAHTKLGRILCSLYEINGLGDRVAQFGELGPKIEKALKAIADKRLVLPIVPSTASVNREVEKQNSLLLKANYDQHIERVNQMMMALNDPRIPPENKKYLFSAIKGSDYLMRVVLRAFGLDEVDKLVPEPQMPQEPQGGAPGQGTPGAPPQGGGPAKPPMPQVTPPGTVQ